jgi:hypothetical protein
MNLDTDDAGYWKCRAVAAKLPVWATMAKKR